MSSPIARLLILVCAALAVVPATAGAARKSSVPKVKSVTPMKLEIGDRLTIKGTGFLKGKNRNTVVFKASGQRAVFVKAQSATSKKLVVKVPAKLVSFLKVRSGQSVATRFQIRVLARKLSRSYTRTKGSPVIAPNGATSAPAAKKAAKRAPAAAAAPAAVPPPDCDADGRPDATDADDDNDLLPDTLERTLRTGVCSADSDGDGMEDGWEYQSARDLNAESCPAADHPVACAAIKPYPAKTEYTNPLFSDAGEDYDGDFLPAWFEYSAWKQHGATTLDELWYSDGTQSSQDSDDSDGCRGLTEDPGADGHVDGYPTGKVAHPAKGSPATRYGWLYGHEAYTLDTHADDLDHPNRGCLNDGERDEDGDFLSNSQELNRMMSGREYVRDLFVEPVFRTEFKRTQPLDADTDGDGIVDGLDDQDNDDFWNVEEIVRGSESSREVSGSAVDTELRTGLWVDPYNPCLPAIHSRTCPDGLLLNGAVWRPFAADVDDKPLRRWPLYHRSIYDGDVDDAVAEIWTGPGIPLAGEQTLPLQQPGDADPGPEHPLLPRPS